MTSDLDAKGPAVHSSERDTERDNRSTQAAPQPDNDPSGIAAWLIRQAQQFEDQHAPQHLTIGLREAAGEIKRLRAKLALFACDCAVNERCAVPDNCRNFQARRMLERPHAD